jgi:hypothetical protein
MTKNTDNQESVLERNIAKLKSREFQSIPAESMSGNAGDNAVSVNTYIKKDTGEITLITSKPVQSKDLYGITFHLSREGEILEAYDMNNLSKIPLGECDNLTDTVKQAILDAIPPVNEHIQELNRRDMVTVQKEIKRRKKKLERQKERPGFLRRILAGAYS